MPRKTKCPFVARRGRIPNQFVGEDANSIIAGIEQSFTDSAGWELPQIIAIGAAPKSGLSALISELAGLAEISGFIVPQHVEPVVSTNRMPLVSIAESMLIDDDVNATMRRDDVISKIETAESAEDAALAMFSAFEERFSGCESPALLVPLDGAGSDGGFSLESACLALSDIHAAFPSARLAVLVGWLPVDAIDLLNEIPIASQGGFERSLYLLRSTSAEEISDWYASALSMSGIDGAYGEDGGVSPLVMKMGESVGGDMMLAQAIGAKVWKTCSGTGRLTERAVAEAIGKAKERYGKR